MSPTRAAPLFLIGCLFLLGGNLVQIHSQDAQTLIDSLQHKYQNPANDTARAGTGTTVVQPSTDSSGASKLGKDTAVKSDAQILPVQTDGSSITANQPCPCPCATQASDPDSMNPQNDSSMVPGDTGISPDTQAVPGTPDTGKSIPKY